MEKFQSFYFKLVPLFSAIFLLYWSYVSYGNMKSGNIERMRLDIFIAALFGIALIISLIFIFMSKKTK